MKQEVGNDATAFDGMWCRANGTEIDLGAMTFQPNKYLMSGRMETSNAVSWKSRTLNMGLALTLLTLFIQ